MNLRSLVPGRLALALALGVAPAARAAPDHRDDADAKLARSIASTFSNRDPVLSPEGDALAFVSTRDGTPELYLSDPRHPEQAPRRLTSLHERVSGPLFTPDGRSILFTVDRGSDENFSIYRIRRDGSHLEELTPGEKVQHGPPFIPLRATDRMVYAVRTTTGPESSIYVQPLAPTRKPRLAYRDPHPCFLTDVSPDGTRALLERKSSGYDSVLVLVDLEKGEARQVYPATGASAEVLDASFSVDGKRIFVATDGGGEQALVLALDAETLAEVGRYTEQHPATATINSLVPTVDGRSLLAEVYAGDHAELRVLDPATLKPRLNVNLPLGDGDFGRSRGSGGWLAVAWSTPERPTDLYGVNLETAELRPLRRDPRPALDQLGGVRVSREEVTSFDGTRVPVNVYLPTPAPQAKLPVLVWMHGGPPSASTFGFDPLLRFYLAKGFAIVAPNVRGSAGFGRAYVHADDGPKRHDAIRDMEQVGHWVAAQPWADPGRLVLGGASYGGYMTLMGLTHQTSLWKAGIDAFGIYNWHTFMKTTAGAIHEIFQTEVGAESDTALLDALSPSTAVDQIVAPLYVYAGANDPRVPKGESDQLVASLKKRGVPVEYQLQLDEGHSFSHRESLVAFLARSARFLESQMKPPPASDR